MYSLSSNCHIIIIIVYNMNFVELHKNDENLQLVGESVNVLI